MSDEKKDSCPVGDMISMGPEIAPGVHPAVRHDADHGISAGMLHIVKDGEPMPDNTLILQRAEGSSYHVLGEVSKIGNHSGPAMVSSNAYRQGWDTIFGNKTVVGQA